MGLIRISCFPAISDTLAEEVEGLGFQVINKEFTAVEVHGELVDTYQLNLHLRTANRILWHLNSFEASSPEELYKEVNKMDWSRHFTINDYFSIYSVVKNDNIKDTRFANLKFKDAVADHFMEKFGKRPDSGPERVQVVIYFHWKDKDCSVWLDTSGETIARRGYRKIPYKAPLQETLAAAIIRNTTWNKQTTFIDPMCGSGTLAIEAALMAINKAPGFTRADFGFKHINSYDPEYWNQLLKTARGNQISQPEVKIIACDRDIVALNAAKTNAQKAGVDRLIDFVASDVFDLKIPAGPGVIILNPPYGERLGQTTELVTLYSKIGDFFKQKCAGYSGYIFTGNPDLAKKVGLKTSKKTQFFNGKIECRLLEYELYSGSKKPGKQ